MFHLSEPEHGWIYVTFGEPPGAFTLFASDNSSDCLCELAGALARLLRHSTEEAVEFFLEPDIAICELHRESDTVHIILTLPDQKEAVFEAWFSLHAFARKVRFELLRIRPRFSVKGGWMQPFPEQEVANLA